MFMEGLGGITVLEYNGVFQNPNVMIILLKIQTPSKPGVYEKHLKAPPSDHNVSCNGRVVPSTFPLIKFGGK